MGKSKVKRELVKEETLTRVAGYIRRGWTYSMIAEREQVTTPMVWKWVNELRTRWRATQQEAIEDLVQEKIEQLTEIVRECMDAWERSKKDSEKVVEEYASALDEEEDGDGGKSKGRKGKGKGPSVKGGLRGDSTGGDIRPFSQEKLVLIKKAVTTEGRLPASEYLRIAKDCYSEICKLRGLYPAEKKDVTVQTLDWTALLETPGSLPDDSIDRALEGMIRELPEHPKEQE
jgi:hypothetical protein